MTTGSPTTRRRLLAWSAGIAGLLVADPGPLTDRTEVAIWLSRAAASYRSIGDRIEGILEPALAQSLLGARIAVRSRPIPLDVQQGSRLMTETWPKLVVAGLLGSGPVRPAGGINILVTDGNPGVYPAGYGMAGVAALTGAADLASISGDEAQSEVVDYTRRTAVAQLLLHECGHAFGLEHRHGTVTLEDHALVASPMVGAYAWAPAAVKRRELGRDSNCCGDRYPPDTGAPHRLGLRYGPCALDALG